MRNIQYASVSTVTHPLFQNMKAEGMLSIASTSRCNEKQLMDVDPPVYNHGDKINDNSDDDDDDDRNGDNDIEDDEEDFDESS